MYIYHSYVRRVNIYNSPHTERKEYHIPGGILYIRPVFAPESILDSLQGAIRSSRSTITPHDQLKSPSGNPSIHFSPSNGPSWEVSLLKFLGERYFVASALDFNFTEFIPRLFPDRSLYLLSVILAPDSYLRTKKNMTHPELLR